MYTVIFAMISYVLSGKHRFLDIFITSGSCNPSLGDRQVIMYVPIKPQHSTSPYSRPADHLIEVGLCFLPCGYQGSNSGSQAWQQVPLSTDPSALALKYKDICIFTKQPI